MLGPSGIVWKASWGPLGPIGSLLGLRKRVPASLNPPCRDLAGTLPGPCRDLARTLPGPCQDLAGTLRRVLFILGPPGAATRARTGTIRHLLPEIFARLWPVGPANFLFSEGRFSLFAIDTSLGGSWDYEARAPHSMRASHGISRASGTCTSRISRSRNVARIWARS